MDKTLLVIAPGKDTSIGDTLFTILVAETGEALASHVCSNYLFAYGDLYGNRPERKEEWTNRFGEVEVKYIDEVGLSVEEMVRRNEVWYQKNNQ